MPLKRVLDAMTVDEVNISFKRRKVVVPPRLKIKAQAQFNVATCQDMTLLYHEHWFA